MTTGEAALIWIGTVVLLALCAGALWGYAAAFGVVALLLHALALVHLLAKRITRGLMVAMRNPTYWGR